MTFKGPFQPKLFYGSMIFQKFDLSVRDRSRLFLDHYKGTTLN